MEVTIEIQPATVQMNIEQTITKIKEDVVPRLSPNPDLMEITRGLCRWMDHYDENLSRHGWRTAHYSETLGKACGLDTGNLALVHCAGLIHDIGKLTIPPEILNKQAPLSGDEYALIECHPRAGAQLLMNFPLLERPATWVAHHHERWDGLGYPYGIKGNFIPLGSRILAVADTFDALSSQPPFGKGYSFPQALKYLGILSGTQLDPGLVRNFHQSLENGVESFMSTSQFFF